MLQETNKLLKGLKDGTINHDDIPEYIDLYDRLKAATADTKEKRKAIRNKFNNKVANRATMGITAICLSLYIYKGAELIINGRNEDDSNLEIVDPEIWANHRPLGNEPKLL